MNDIKIKYLFIVPYRDREQHKIFYKHYMKLILSDYPKKIYDIWFIHQKDKRPFNRGALKNIGFLIAKNTYSYYKDIVFIFNDIDTVPYDKNILCYHTIPGVIKHFYGFKFALGGIFSITGRDFELINGFPNFWSWGFEDNCINQRALAKKIKIDRSNFYKIGDKHILQLFDGVTRNLSVNNISRVKKDAHTDGIWTITNLKFNKENDEYLIHGFDVPIKPNTETYAEYDVRQGSKITEKQFNFKSNNNQFLM